jgi:plasmid stabilization system protein ParE
MMLVTMSITACTQNVTETPAHKVETIAELFDSLANRGAPPSHELRCYRDSMMSDEYTIFTVVEDTTQKTDEADKDWYRHAADNQRFLLRNATYLVEKLCKTAVESYRYSTPDSVNYSITIKKEPETLLTFQHYKGNRNADCIVLYYTIKKPAKILPKPCDPKLTQALLKQFLAEQKDVKQYPVHYEWDKGVPFPNEGEFYTSFTQHRGHSADSLAASLVTGIHYIIPAKGEEQAKKLENELCDRLTRLYTEQPVIGSNLRTTIRPGLKMKRLSMFWLWPNGKDRRRTIYELQTEVFDDGLHILELNTADAPRFTVPLNWWVIMRTHNTKIFYLDEWKEHI